MTGSRKILRSLTNFWRRPLQEKLLFAQAFIILGITRLLINTVAFKRLAKHLGHPGKRSSTECAEHKTHEAQRVAWAVQRASRFTPWESTCLPQAMTAQYLLRRRNIPSTLYLGTDFDSQEDAKAHAWLRSGQRFITGRAGHGDYTVVATFTHQ